MKRKIYFTCLVVLAFASPQIYSQGTITFFGRAGVPGTEYILDKDLVDSLTLWGYTVNYVSTLPADLTGNIGLFISETISSSTANDFADAGLNYPIPCVNLEGWTPRSDRWGWVTDNTTEWYQAKNDLFPDTEGEELDGQIITITDNSHYITQGYTVGQEVRWAETDVQSVLEETNPCSFKEVNKTFSKKLAKSKLMADAGEDFWTMITIDSAEADFPNRIFVWGMIADAVQGSETTGRTFHYGTPDFWKIIRRASDWTFGVAEPLGTKDRFGIELHTHVFPIPATEKATIRFFAPANMDIRISLHNITGQEVTVLKDDQALMGYNFITVDASNYSPGLYFVKIKNNDKASITKLLIK